MARFAGKAYVLPRTGQRGIPLVSVNTKAVDIAVYRISDRNLIETVLGRDFQRNLYPYEIERLTDSRGIKVWNGELAVEQTLNAEITTAFPVDQAIGDMAPGVYVMTAAAKGTTLGRFRRAVDAMVHRLRHGARGLFRQRRHQRVRQFAGHDRAQGPGRGAADVARQRNPQHQEERRRGPRRLRGRAVARRGRAVARHAGRDRRQGRLRLPQSERPGVRSERPRRQGPPGGGGARCLRLHRARRLSLRRDRACHVAAARRAGRGGAERAADARGRAAGRHRISPRRGARPGRRRPFARRADQSVGLDRHLARARLHRSEASGGRRDHLPGRGLRARPPGVRSRGAGRQDLAERAGQADGRRPLSLRRAGLGARSRRRDRRSARPRSGRVSPAISSASPTRRSRPSASRSKTCRRPTTRARRASRSRSTRCRRRRVRSKPR